MLVSEVIAAFELVIPEARECRNRTCIKRQRIDEQIDVAAPPSGIPITVVTDVAL